MNPLDRYVAFMEAVESFDLDKLEELIGENIHFVDPFNDTLGLTKYRAIIEDMREQLSNLKIEVISSAMIDSSSNTGSPSQQGNALIRWHLSGNLKAFKDRYWAVEGCSAISFDDEGRVTEHLDYWDAAGQLYESFPVVGWVLKYLRRKLAT